MLVYRAASPLPTTRRIVHLAVDRADRAPGHAAVQTFVQRLSSRLGAPVVPVALPSRASDLLADVAIQPGDLIVLEASREGRVAWTPALRTLPRRLAAAYPDAPLVVAYPPEDPDALSEGLGLALRG